MIANATKKSYRCIGIMSGTSLDGVDIVAVSFTHQGSWSFQINAAKTYAYNPEILNRLKKSQSISGLSLSLLDTDYGKYLGHLTKGFCAQLNYVPDFVASHGYTVFHEPQKGLTLQIGSGAQISAVTGLKTICDFRTLDVAMGGQGAPLVPIGDQLLFGGYVACLNLGGFSNISYQNRSERMAYDICPVNYVLNHYAGMLGNSFDNGGDLARSGRVNESLLCKLNQLSYYKQSAPKSLGREFVEKEIYPLIPGDYSAVDVLATFTEHVAIQLASVMNKLPKGEVLITGGGAFNTFLIEKIASKTNHCITLPSKEIIDFKEALIFAFLGVLRKEGVNNCLASVTGASSDNCGGAVYHT